MNDKTGLNLKFDFSYGQSFSEYLIILTLIAVAAIASFKYFGQTIRAQVAGLSIEIAGGTTEGVERLENIAAAAEATAEHNLHLGNYNGLQQRNGAGQ